MIHKQRIMVLLQQFADNNISKLEYTELINYFNLTGNEEDIFAAMDGIWKNTDAEVWHSEEEVNKIYTNLISNKEFKTASPAVPVRKLWYRIAAAAGVLITLSAGLYLYTNRYSAPASQRFAKNDIAPGSNRAILTLANGKKIDLSGAGNGELAKQAGISIRKTKTGQLVYTISGNTDNNSAGNNSTGSSSNSSIGAATAYNTISTPRGGEYQVNLPDGTTVWLNAASSLRFPVQFKQEDRKVTLSGEAYFEVAKQIRKVLIHGKAIAERIPFVVKTNRQEVEVLGTHFNINAYTNETRTRTTLLEGAVRVSLLSNAAQTSPTPYYLQPGQQANLSGNAFRIMKADMEEAMAWKKGIFMFNGQDLEGIMKQVERWYDVDVVFEDDNLKRQTFTGTISRFKKISQLLEVLETTGSVHFKMEGRRITAM